MSHPTLKTLSPMSFTHMTPERENKIIDAPDTMPPSKNSYHANTLASELHPPVQHLIVSEIIEHNADIKSYCLTADTQKGTTKLAYFNAGQYLSLTITVNSLTVTRPYSICSSPREALEGKYMLTVKRVDGGLVSGYILDNWEIGTTVTASAPLGHFNYEPLRDASTIVGIAGGSGITPFISMAKAIAEGDEDASLILFYGSRTLSEAIFTQELRQLEAACSKIKIINVLSHETKEDCEKGFVTAQLISKYITTTPYSVFICGPQSMHEFTDEQLKLLSINPKYIRHELFGEYTAPSHDAAYPSSVPSKITITVRTDGNDTSIVADSSVTILRSLETNGIFSPAQCRSGECGWCHSKLVSGDIYTPASMDKRRAADQIFGYIHPCCSFPLTDIVIEISAQMQSK